MTNEIKEILDILERRLPFAVAPEFAYMTAIITPQECKILLDYITNLQEENERLKDSLETMTFTAKIKQEAIDGLIKKMDKAIELIDEPIYYATDIGYI